jgi:hypothetical protein
MVIGDSARNYNLMNEESTGGIDIPPGITSSWTRNTPEECLFSRESSIQGRGIHRKKRDSARNYRLIDEKFTRRRGLPRITCSFTLIQTGKIKMRRKFSER